MADTAESMLVDVGGTASGLDGPPAFVTNEPAAATSACMLAVPMVGDNERSLSPSVVLADAAVVPLSTVTTAVDGAIATSSASDAGTLQDGARVASASNDAECLRCLGNHRQSHTCGKRRNRPAFAPRERSSRPRSATNVALLNHSTAGSLGQELARQAG